MRRCGDADAECGCGCGLAADAEMRKFEDVDTRMRMQRFGFLLGCGDAGVELRSCGCGEAV